MNHISDAVSDVIADVFSGTENIHKEIWKNWFKIVGEQMYMRTFPKFYQNRLLVVGVTSSPWLQELNIIKGKLVRRINRVAGKGTVKEIRLVLDSDIGKLQNVLPKPFVPEPVEPDMSLLDSDIISSAENIEDNDLKEAVKRAAAANLEK
jgi:hypothetical protein